MRRRYRLGHKLNTPNKLTYITVSWLILLLIGLYVPIAYILLLPILLGTALKDYIDSYFDRIAASVTLIATINIVLGVVLWGLNTPLTLPHVYALHGMIAAALVLVLLIQDSSKHLLPKKADMQALPAITLAVLIFFLLFTPLVLKHSTNYVYQFFLFGGDNTAHLELTKVVEKNKGFLYKDVEDTKDIITSNSTAYPQGLALNMYIARGYVSNILSIDSPKKELYIFLLFTTLMYSLLCFVWTRLGHQILSLYGKGKSFKLHSILLSAILFLGPFLHFYTNGFQTHIVALIVLGQIIGISIALFNRSHGKRLFLILILFFLNILISYTWLFLAPVTLLASGLISVKVLYDSIIAKRFGADLRKNLSVVILVIILSLICFIQVYIQITYGIKQNSINESGYILPPPQSVVMLSGFIAIMLYALPRNEKVSTIIPFVVFSWVIVIFNICLYIYQLVTVGYPEYYYFKSAYHLILLGTVALPAILLYLSRKLSKSQKVYFQMVTGLMIVLTMLEVVPRYTAPILSASVANVSSSLINSYGDIINVEPSKTSGVISIDSCNRQEDFLVTKLSGILGNDNTFLRQQIAFSIIRDSSNRTDLIKEYQAKLAQENQQIIILDNNLDSDQYLGTIGSNKTIINVPAGPNHNVCPNLFTGSKSPASSNPRKPF